MAPVFFFLLLLGSLLLVMFLLLEVLVRHRIEHPDMFEAPQVRIPQEE